MWCHGKIHLHSFACCHLVVPAPFGEIPILLQEWLGILPQNHLAMDVRSYCCTSVLFQCCVRVTLSQGHGDCCLVWSLKSGIMSLHRLLFPPFHKCLVNSRFLALPEEFYSQLADSYKELDGDLHRDFVESVDQFRDECHVSTKVPLNYFWQIWYFTENTLYTSLVKFTCKCYICFDVIENGIVFVSPFSAWCCKRIGIFWFLYINLVSCTLLNSFFSSNRLTCLCVWIP